MDPKMCAHMCSTQPNMQSMEQLGGSGGMPPQEIFENRCSETDFGVFSR